MNKIILFISLLLGTTYCYSQNNFNKLYPLGENATINLSSAIISFDDFFIVASILYLESGACQLTKIDNNGNIIHTKLIENFFPGFDSPLIYDGKNIILVGSSTQKVNNGRNFVLKVLSLNFETIDEIIFASIDNEVLNPEGIYVFEKKYYLYGTRVYYPSKQIKGIVIKLNQLSNQKEWEKTYSIKNALHPRLVGLSTKNSENISFVVQNSAVSGPTQTLISVNNTDGEVIKKRLFKFSGINDDFIPSKIIGKNGNYYFTSHVEPSEIDGYNVDYGAITKVDSQLDSILLSKLYIPLDITQIGRTYIANQMIITKKGNIVLSGTVQDVFEKDKVDWKLSGFVLCFNTTLELQWLKIYKNKLREGEKSEPNRGGKYKHSIFNKIVERQNGSFVLLGESPYWDSTLTQHYDIWILSIDENGCFISSNCDEVNILDIELANLESHQNIFPNPCHNTLNINNNSFYMYQIINITGNIVKQDLLKETINVNSLLTGNYFLKLIHKDGKFKIHKFIKQ